MITKLGTETTLLGSEGIAFYKVYDSLNGIMNEEDIINILTRFDTKDWFRTTIFLGVLRALPLEKFYHSADNLSLSHKVPEFICKQSYKISLDTAALLGTDIAIKLSFNEGVPNPINNMEDFFDFIGEDLKFIIPLVIGLRAAEGTVGGVKAIERFGENYNKGLNVVVNKEGKVTIEGLRVDIRRLKQQVDILNQKKQTRAVNSEKKKVRTALQEKKQDFKELKELNEYSSSDETEMQEGYKPKSEDSIREDLNWDVVYQEIGVKLDTIKLEDVIKGFNLKDNIVSGEGISKGFKDMLNRFKGNETIEKISNDVGSVIDGEFSKLVEFLDSLYLKGINDRQIDEITKFKQRMEKIKTRIKGEFLESLESRIRGQEINKDYAYDIRWLKPRIDMFVSEMYLPLKLEVSKGLKGFKYDEQKR